MTLSMHGRFKLIPSLNSTDLVSIPPLSHARERREPWISSSKKFKQTEYNLFSYLAHISVIIVMMCDMSEVISMYQVGFLILENLHFATDFNKLCAQEQKLYPFNDFSSHLGGHLGFTHLDMLGVLLLYLVELLIYENLYLASNILPLISLSYLL